MSKMESIGSANVGRVTNNHKFKLHSWASALIFKQKIEAINGTYMKGGKRLGRAICRGFNDTVPR